MRFMEEMLYVVLLTFLFAAALFYHGGRKHFSFSHSYKISGYSSNEIGLLCIFLSLALAISLLSMPM